jgi:DNA helicase HerA-like ATPase
LMNAPQLYSTFLLWMLSELYEHLPEVGDPEKPAVVFFFDEAHLLFTDAPAPLLEKIEQVVRLIRSKGVGVYFVTQNPLDVPDTVLGQLGNRVQHALHAFTPQDQKAVKTAAQTLRPNPALNTERVISELGVGEALVSFLDEKGSPSVVERAWILPPASRIGPLTAAERAGVISASVVGSHYAQSIDRESAYEQLKARTLERTSGAGTTPFATPTPAAPSAARSMPSVLSDLLFGSVGPRGGRHEGLLGSAARSAARSIGSGVGREIIRGVLGSILGGRPRRP